jgi:hypothetical protein
MFMKWKLSVIALVVILSGQAWAQSTVADPDISPVHVLGKGATWEYGAYFQGGPGLEQRTDYSFLLAGVQVGKVLTPELGHGVLKGNFESHTGSPSRPSSSTSSTAQLVLPLLPSAMGR